MPALQRAGGWAALMLALAYVVGFAVMATLLDPGRTDGWSVARKLEYVLAHKDLLQAWTMFIYVFAGLALVVLAIAVHERLKARAPALMPVTTAIGLVWAGLVIGSGMIDIHGLERVAALHAKDATQATSAWIAISIVRDALGGGIEIVGGVWVGLISVAALRVRALPRWVTAWGFVVGAAGMLSVVPALGAFVDVFGLGQIPWFVGIGVALLRGAAVEARVGGA